MYLYAAAPMWWTANEEKVQPEQEQRMQAIKGVSMFYARSSRINSGIIQVEWMCFAVVLYSLACARQKCVFVILFRFGIEFTTILFVVLLFRFVSFLLHPPNCKTRFLFSMSPCQPHHFAWLCETFIGLYGCEPKGMLTNKYNKSRGILESKTRYSHGIIQASGNKKWKGDKVVLNIADKKIHLVYALCTMKRWIQVNCAHCSAFQIFDCCGWYFDNEK